MFIISACRNQHWVWNQTATPPACARSSGSEWRRRVALGRLGLAKARATTEQQTEAARLTEQIACRSARSLLRGVCWKALFSEAKASFVGNGCTLGDFIVSLDGRSVAMAVVADAFWEQRAMQQTSDVGKSWETLSSFFCFRCVQPFEVWEGGIPEPNAASWRRLATRHRIVRTFSSGTHAPVTCRVSSLSFRESSSERSSSSSSHGISPAPIGTDPAPWHWPSHIFGQLVRVEMKRDGLMGFRIACNGPEHRLTCRTYRSFQVDMDVLGPRARSSTWERGAVPGEGVARRAPEVDYCGRRLQGQRASFMELSVAGVLSLTEFQEPQLMTIT